MRIPGTLLIGDRVDVYRLVRKVESETTSTTESTPVSETIEDEAEEEEDDEEAKFVKSVMATQKGGEAEDAPEVYLWHRIPMTV